MGLSLINRAVCAAKQTLKSHLASLETTVARLMEIKVTPSSTVSSGLGQTQTSHTRGYSRLNPTSLKIMASSLLAPTGQEAGFLISLHVKLLQVI